MYKSLVESLNKSQKEVVVAPLSNMLVLAGAGTGKTRVLVSRIAYLLEVEGLTSRDILALTFTNKAAKEMQERLSLLSDDNKNAEPAHYLSYSKIWASSFHSLCARLLRINATEANLQPAFTIIDSALQLSLVKRILKDNYGTSNEVVKQADEICDYINKEKEAGRRSNVKKTIGQNQIFVDVFKRYEDICEKEGIVDFAELLLRTVELLENRQDIRDFYQNRFKYILVDEFQDTNDLQYKLLKLLHKDTNYIFAVGDDDQSIYGWRGAKVKNLSSFLKDFSNAKTYKLELNYRSSQNILDVANALIEGNSWRLEKKVLQSFSDDKGQKVGLTRCKNPKDEANFVVSMIRQYLNKGFKPSDIAILYRNNAQSLEFEKMLATYSLPYTVYGGMLFYEREEIKNVISYLSLIENPNADSHLLRVINVPKRGLGTAAINTLIEIARERDISLFSAITAICTSVTSNEKVDRKFVALSKKLIPFLNLIEQYREQKDSLPLSDLIYKIATDSGLYLYYKEKDEKENKFAGNLRVENIDSLRSAAMDFEEEFNDIKENGYDNDFLDLDNKLQSFLSSVSLKSTTELNENGESQEKSLDCVNLMTIHASKGLEFKIVFIVGFEYGLLPYTRFRDSQDSDREDEERRLAYVAITRAKEKLFISYCLERGFFSSFGFEYEKTGISPFIRDLVNVIKERKAIDDFPIGRISWDMG